MTGFINNVIDPCIWSDEVQPFLPDFEEDGNTIQLKSFIFLYSVVQRRIYKTKYIFVNAVGHIALKFCCCSCADCFCFLLLTC